MTTAQKIIKYAATAFAIFLIVTIISAILSSGYALLCALEIIHTKNNIVTENFVTENLKVISSEVKEVSTLNIDLACTNLNINKNKITSFTSSPTSFFLSLLIVSIL